VRRLGLRSSYLCSPVAGIIVLAATLVAAEAGAVATNNGLQALAGPLRDIAVSGTLEDVAELVTVTDAGLVRVEVRFRSVREAAATDLGRYGAVVELRRDVRAQCVVPPCGLLEIASLPQVTQVAPPARAVPCQAIGFGATLSEAVQLTNASSMQGAGFAGAGARIAIIDLGFLDVDTAEVPTYDIVSLRSDGSTDAGQHGTAVAEHVADMAPEAALTLIAVDDTPMSLESAADFVAARGFNVAVMSLVVLEGPFDGTHPLSRAVDSTANAGVLWVQAAGNFAQRHYAGTFTDQNGDNLHEFQSSQDFANFPVVAAGRIEIYLSWYETAGPVTSQDYDLVLLDSLGNFVAQSAFSQDGTTPPREQLIALLPAGDTYRIQILRVSGDITQEDSFQLFVKYETGELSQTLQVPESSIGIPAEAPGAFTVGATRGTLVDPAPYTQFAQPVDTIELWSGQGPGLNGVLKPDIVAPDACRTSLAAPGTGIYDADYYEWLGASAFGTSFAAAHVAGAAALLFSEDTTRTAPQLRDALIKLTIPVPPPLPTDPPLPNNIYGNGRLSLRVGTDIEKPVAVITYPRSGDTISTTEPVVTGYLTDVGGGVDASTIELTLDGDVVTGWLFDPQTGLLSYRVSPPNHAALSRSSHRLTLDVSDVNGNTGDQAVSTFRVAPPSIDAGLHMISLPFGSLADPRPSSIFGLPQEQVLVVRWLPTDGTTGDKYHWWGGPTGVEDQYASFEPLDTKEPPFVVGSPPAGLGYFLSIPTPAILNVSGTSLADRVSYDIKLSAGISQPRGWNMIGCPFPDAVTWGGVEFITGSARQDLREAMEAGVTEGVLFELKRAGSSFYYDFPPDPLSGSLQPFKGYWLHVLKDTTLRVYNSVITTGTGAPAQVGQAAQPSEGDWSLKFGAVAAGHQDPANYIGVSAQASDGYDPANDVPEPPALASAVRVTLAHEDWGERSGDYARDIRGAVGMRQEWDVVVSCTAPEADVSLNWSELNATVPAGVSLVLQDLDGGKDVFMRTVAGYTYRSAGNESVRHFRIVAAPAGEQTLALTNVTAQQTSEGTVQVSYTVSCAAEVSAEVLNIAGRSIRRLGDGTATAGSVQTLTWDGRNGFGALAPAGRYMVRLTARTHSGQASNTVRTFQVGR